MLKGSNYKNASELSKYSKRYHKQVEYIFKYMPEIDKNFKIFNFHSNIKKTNFSNNYDPHFIPYVSYFLNHNKKSKVLEISDAYHLNYREYMYKQNNYLDPKLILLDSYTQTYTEDYKKDIKNKFKNYLFMPQNSDNISNNISNRFISYKSEFNSYDMIFGIPKCGMNFFS